MKGQPYPGRSAAHARKHDYNAIYHFIVKYKRENDGLSPTLEQIMLACRVNSKSNMSSILRILEDEGKIVVNSKISRGIQVIGGKWSMTGDP